MAGRPVATARRSVGGFLPSAPSIRRKLGLRQGLGEGPGLYQKSAKR